MENGYAKHCPLAVESELPSGIIGARLPLSLTELHQFCYLYRCLVTCIVAVCLPLFLIELDSVDRGGEGEGVSNGKLELMTTVFDLEFLVDR